MGNEANINAEYYFSDAQLNELDNFDSTTYHFRLYMMPMLNYSNKQWFDTSRQITIAESGKTQLGIEEVEITSIIAPSQGNGMSEALTINFKINEPNGAVFFDKLHKSAQELGVENYTKAPYILELTFMGRSKTTSYPVDLKKKWIWPISILKADMSTTAGGSTYDMEATVVGQTALSNQAGDLDKNISVAGDTAPDMLADLKDKLKINEEDKSKNNQQLLDSWEFIFHGDFRGSTAKSDLRIIEIDDAYHPSRSSEPVEKVTKNGQSSQATTEVVQSKGKIASFPPTNSIISIVDAIMASTQYIKKQVIDKDNDKGDNTAEPNFKIKKLYRIIPETIFQEYDVKRNDYQKTYRYHILPYMTSKSVNDPKQVNNIPETSANTFSEIQSNGMISKHYNYMFTGKNDQIIDFDMKFNLMWFAPTPPQGGIFSTATETGGVLINTKAQQKADAATAKEKKGKHAVKEVNPDSATPAKSSSGAEAETSISKESTRTAKVNYKTTQRYADLPVTTRAIDTVLPISMQESTIKGSNIQSLEDPANGSKSLVSSVFAQYNEDPNAELLKIDLNIKGDPFWLADQPYTGTSKTSKALGIDEIIAEELRKDGVPKLNSKASDSFFLFTSQTPTFDATHNGKGFTQNTVINGIYQVLKVKSNFQDGKFTQELEAIRHKFVDIKYINLKTQSNSFRGRQ